MISRFLLLEVGSGRRWIIFFETRGASGRRRIEDLAFKDGGIVARVDANLRGGQKSRKISLPFGVGRNRVQIG